MPGTPEPLVSPYVWTSPDYAGNKITATFNFDNVTFVLDTVTVVRDAACVYRRFYFGLGPDGIPDSTAKKIPGVTAVAVAVLPAALALLGFSTINDVLAGQITAGP